MDELDELATYNGDTEHDMYNSGNFYGFLKQSDMGNLECYSGSNEEINTVC